MSILNSKLKPFIWVNNTILFQGLTEALHMLYSSKFEVIREVKVRRKLYDQ